MHVICPHLAVQGLHLFFQHNRPKADIREARENTAERERPISELIAGPTRVIPRTFIPPQAAYLSSIHLVKAKTKYVPRPNA